MAFTASHCCCLILICLSLFSYLMLLLLDHHIESIIDSYHIKNIIDHCSSLLETEKTDHPFNEIHEIVNEDNYHYHYYEKNMHGFKYDFLQSSICHKIKHKLDKQQLKARSGRKRRTSRKTRRSQRKAPEYDDAAQPSDDGDKPNKEIVHETWHCNYNEHHCNHCIYYKSIPASLQWTKCQIEPRVNLNRSSYGFKQPNPMKMRRKQTVKNIKSEVYTSSLSEFANSMKTWSDDILHRDVNMSRRDNVTFLYVENESCHDADCLLLEQCAIYESEYNTTKKCHLVKNDLFYNETVIDRSDIAHFSLNWYNVLIGVTLVFLISSCVSCYQTEAICEEYMWKTRALSLCQKYSVQNVCPICYEDLGFVNECILRCGHRFHRRCIDQWESQQRNRIAAMHTWWYALLALIKIRHKCPSCNRRYKSVGQKYSYQRKYADY